MQPLHISKVLATVAIVCCALAVGACAPEAPEPNEPDQMHGNATPPAGSVTPTPTDSEEDPMLHTSQTQVTGTEKAVVTTSKGVITLEFFAEDAPNTVASFIELIESGFYDGIKFHRVVPTFVVQGGDPQTRDLTPEQVVEIVGRQANNDYRPGEPMIGTGGPGWNQKAEFNSRKHERGTLAMARSRDVDSAGSQFYICLEPQPRLDGDYTVFGQVVSGMEVVDAIEVGDVIESVIIER
jgi:peptidyl-prolyl cis-trans isomerase B (cyclophilin B)